MPKRKFANSDSKPSKSAKHYGPNEDRHNEASALIDSTFLLKCPLDFYEFYAFCSSVSPDSPLGMYKP